MKFTDDCSAELTKLKKALNSCDAVLIGAGSGLSTAAGFSYGGERFLKYFSDFNEKYGITDMYSGGFYPFKTENEYWAWWSRHIYVNRYDVDAGKPYRDLLNVVKDREYFVITTNVDHQFQMAGFDKGRLFYTQGDYGLFQCSVPCCKKTFDNETQVREMIARQKDMRVPDELLPRCPVCGKPMTVNLRCDDKFVEDDGWHRARDNYTKFLNKYAQKRLLLLELGVGGNTPVIIKYPFWRLTMQNPRAVYACINMGEAFCPAEIRRQSICIDDDIQEVLSNLVEE